MDQYTTPWTQDTPHFGQCGWYIAQILKNLAGYRGIEVVLWERQPCRIAEVEFYRRLIGTAHTSNTKIT